MAMQTTVERVEARVPVTVMALSGELDASNYLRLVDDVRPLYAAGARNLLLDLTDLSFISSSGLVSLYSILKVMQGEEPPDPEYGWSALHTMERDAEDGDDAGRRTSLRDAARGRRCHPADRPRRAVPELPGPRGGVGGVLAAASRSQELVLTDVAAPEAIEAILRPFARSAGGACGPIRGGRVEPDRSGVDAPRMTRDILVDGRFLGRHHRGGSCRARSALSRRLSSRSRSPSSSSRVPVGCPTRPRQRMPAAGSRPSWP